MTIKRALLRTLDANIPDGASRADILAEILNDPDVPFDEAYEYAERLADERGTEY